MTSPIENHGFRSSHPEVFLRKGVLKIYSKFTGEQPWRNMILIKLRSKFIQIARRHECPPVNLLHIFRTPFPRNTSGWLLLWLLTPFVTLKYLHNTYFSVLPHCFIIMLLSCLSNFTEVCFKNFRNHFCL